jgi:hypothetical protein
MKVYCEKCKHHRWSRLFIEHFCKLETIDTPYGESLAHGVAEKKNGNNDCKDFKQRTFWDKFNIGAK